MLKFIKRGKKYIYSLDEKKYVRGQDLRDLLKNNIPFEYVDQTGKNLIPGLAKGTRKTAKPVIDELLGPDMPLNETKLYPCNRCKIQNKNRFRCSNCIQLVEADIEGDNIYNVW